ncbi:MAG TPA: pseudaminic acid cytidylyltransferase [Oculatellaceae cyanobacterium]
MAIIPARGGSKRIPRKNIRSFFGKPMIAYPIQAALDSNSFHTIVVSTDDEEIATIATKYGASTPFLRSSEAASDFATLADVISEVLDQFTKQQQFFDYFCCLLPTAPFVTGGQINAFRDVLLSSGADSVLPIVRFSYPIQRALRTESGRLKMINPEYEQARSNDLLPAYHDVGQFYWMRTQSFLEQRRLFANHSIGIEIRESQCQDIDSEEDWKIAELKYSLMLAQGVDCDSNKAMSADTEFECQLTDIKAIDETEAEA